MRKLFAKTVTVIATKENAELQSLLCNLCKEKGYKVKRETEAKISFLPKLFGIKGKVIYLDGSPEYHSRVNVTPWVYDECAMVYGYTADYAVIGCQKNFDTMINVAIDKGLSLPVACLSREEIANEMDCGNENLLAKAVDLAIGKDNLIANAVGTTKNFMNAFGKDNVLTNAVGTTKNMMKQHAIDWDKIWDIQEDFLSAFPKIGWLEARKQRLWENQGNDFLGKKNEFALNLKKGLAVKFVEEDLKAFMRGR
ncbi:MAG: hypothetical protein FWF59_01250 [Turicibacter sp.]|nr:hypothetical protein [Turicibacter sp.]